MTITDLVRAAHDNAVAKGFWDEPRPFGVLVALMHSELSEALEADRNREGLDRVAEELADCVIRIADTAGALGIDLEAAIREKMARNAQRPRLHGKAY